MSKHTPGPWSVNLPCTDEVVADLGGRDFSVAREIRNHADARLIAAAPELLTQLSRMTDEYAAAMKDAGVSHYPESLAIVREARAAIRKATGSA